MEKDQALKIEASRDFTVTAEQLYKAWNDPEQLKHWWKPMGNSLQEVTNDLRVGGLVKYTFSNNNLVIKGQYEEVQENKKLIYTWNWEFTHDPHKNAEYKLHVHFNNTPNGSSLKVIQENNRQDETLHPNEEGWEKGLSNLEAFLKGNAQMQQPVLNEKSNETPENSGYRELPDQQKVAGG